MKISRDGITRDGVRWRITTARMLRDGWTRCSVLRALLLAKKHRLKWVTLVHLEVRVALDAPQWARAAGMRYEWRVLQPSSTEPARIQIMATGYSRTKRGGVALAHNTVRELWS